MATRKTKAAQATEATEQQVLLKTPAPAATNVTEAAAIQPSEPSSVSALPPLDAPAVNASEPEVSYKIDFSDRSSWHQSTDAGKTKSSAGTNALAGAVVDFALQINKAKGRDGSDYRFRLAFYEQSGRLAELNLNAINSTSDGGQYVTSPARSLVGALLSISESEDDIQAFCEGARFRLRPGTGKGVFVEADIAENGSWIAMASAAATNQVPKHAAGFLACLTQIKARFRAAGLLLSAKAVTGLDESHETPAVNVATNAAD